MQRHAHHGGQFNAAIVKDFGSPKCHVEKRWIAEAVNVVGGFHNIGVGGMNAVDIFQNLAALGLEMGGERHGGGVRTAAAERCDTARLLMDALKTGDDCDFLALLEALDQFGAVDAGDAGRGMRFAGLDRNLPALPRAGIDADVLERDRQQAGGDLLTGGNDQRMESLVLSRQPWPKAHADFLVQDSITLAVQVNGKLRGAIRVPAAASKAMGTPSNTMQRCGANCSSQPCPVADTDTASSTRNQAAIQRRCGDTFGCALAFARQPSQAPGISTSRAQSLANTAA